MNTATETFGTITEELIVSNHTRNELALVYNVDELEIEAIDRELHAKLHDENVSEEDFQKWCDEIDAEYPVWFYKRTI